MVTTGDVHTCHRRTPTHNVLRTLNYIFYEKESLAALDIVTINGDFWDTLKTQSDPDAQVTRQWIRRFVDDCAANDVSLFVLEGTPDHDWKQSAEFVLHKTTCDVHHITDVSVIKHEKTGLTMLFVPDEIRGTHEAIWELVCERMAEANVEKVDLTFIHGGFDFHFPSYLNIPCHSTERYSGIVNYGVFCNHIHRSAHKSLVWGGGSPDRLAHGEEEDKGYFHVDINTSAGTMQVNWIVNPHAWTYRKISIESYSDNIEQILHMVRSEVAGLNAGSWVKLTHCSDQAVGMVIQQLRVEFPQLQWELEMTTNPGAVDTKAVYTKDLYKGVTITPDNAKDTLIDWIKNNYDISDEEITYLHGMYDTVIETMAG